MIIQVSAPSCFCVIFYGANGLVNNLNSVALLPDIYLRNIIKTSLVKISL